MNDAEILEAIRRAVPQDRVQCPCCKSETPCKYMYSERWECKDCGTPFTMDDVVSVVESILYPPSQARP